MSHNDWLFALQAMRERDAALAEVDRLRSLLAEPSEEDLFERLPALFPSAEQRGLHPYDISAVIADLRERAGGER